MGRFVVRKRGGPTHGKADESTDAYRDRTQRMQVRRPVRGRAAEEAMGRFPVECSPFWLLRGRRPHRPAGSMPARRRSL